MDTCQKYKDLHPEWQAQIEVLIKRMKGKSHIAGVTIEDSELTNYEFKVTVCKYNSTGSRGWATIGYLRNDIFRGGIWRLSYKPRLNKNEKVFSGKTGSYG